MARGFFSGSGFFAPPATTPEAYAALIAFFGGDQAAADAYLAQLEGYADDGEDAQALLDAAAAAGDVATAIAILEGGGISLGTYADLKTVVDLIADGTLVEGQGWRIAWTGDTYIPDGEALGIVRYGKPVWSGTIPAPLIGALWTVVSGGVTYDVDGRPILTVTGAAPGSLQAIELDCDLAPFGAVAAVTRFQSIAAVTSGLAGPAAVVGLTASPFVRLLSGLADVGGAWFGVGAGFGNPFGALSPTLNATTEQAVRFEIDVLANNRDLLPKAFTLISHGVNAAQAFDANTAILVGFVDWRADIDLRFRLENTDLGVPSTLMLTGLSYTLVP